MKAMIQYSFPERRKKNVELADECIDEEGPSNSTPGVTSDESHQKSKANQHHDVYILKGRVSRVVQRCT